MNHRNALEQVADHLALMIGKEKQNGEFLLASVVQDSLTYNFHAYAESPFLVDIAHDAAKVAVETTATHMYLNEFAVRESIRGVMHSIVTLSGDPVSVSVAVTTGALNGLEQFEPQEAELLPLRIAVVKGVCAAAEDMGLDAVKMKTVCDHIVQWKSAWHGREWRVEDQPEGERLA
ncbi:hypothetical protein LLE49_01775 [Alicyclobacillus tolerans]|uniref:hypothetical protein n=1 Tax=Alicyclobacillus tolerans TaxID=90970 RepID=UPI001F48C1AF|nr:hypothetical protein [Alicyclobacillus tolerans]MCF8563471.1 hypothetical protein [Alicyclobacillus tolerans]